MRILTWNCAMGLQKKAQHVASFNPDIAVIPECGRVSLPALKRYGYAGVWVGDNSHKGLGIFVRTPWRARLLSRPKQKWIAALDVETLGDPLRLIAVWACKVGNAKCDNYIGQVYKAFTENPAWFTCPHYRCRRLQFKFTVG